MTYVRKVKIEEAIMNITYYMASVVCLCTTVWLLYLSYDTVHGMVQHRRAFDQKLRERTI